MIELRTITRDDWETCIDLKVARHQAHFVASNLYSLAQSRFLPGFRAVGIHHGGRMVGFALYGPDADDGHYWLYRLM
ncbi:GNAT family N-acetyltransferase, partial [Pseudomonas aeruginosa]|nr:GNAT family N-acetyltransferase [Pseudomonas aeruginosa]HCF9841243.1 GNAT family N-acetyltransferase [Pseudomonas aeruginosa]HCW0322921.1 GNAT family N-acetyltransferase [Pseudomonas aeruginosa]